MGELAPKPHPWLYAETARIGLEIPVERSDRVVGLEDSSAGVLSIRLAGFTALGISGGNIERSGIKPPFIRILRFPGGYITLYPG